MEHERLPCLDLLVATPDIPRDPMPEPTDEDARWKPAALGSRRRSRGSA